ncbi:MAG: YraN family protein [bacterium]|nr:YraN family protein [bacterium]
MGVTQKVGALGEELIVMFLMKRSYKILDRNFRRPWGELDIIAERKGKVHFIEVKALSQNIVSDETKAGVSGRDVSDETSVKDAHGASLAYIRSKVRKDRFRAEDHVNAEKIKRLGRIIQTYLNSKDVSDETKWQFDVATVLIDTEAMKAKINLLEDLAI